LYSISQKQGVENEFEFVNLKMLIFIFLLNKDII